MTSRVEYTIQLGPHLIVLRESIIWSSKRVRKKKPSNIKKWPDSRKKKKEVAVRRRRAIGKISMTASSTRRLSPANSFIFSDPLDEFINNAAEKKEKRRSTSPRRSPNRRWRKLIEIVIIFNFFSPHIIIYCVTSRRWGARRVAINIERRRRRRREALINNKVSRRCTCLRWTRVFFTRLTGGGAREYIFDISNYVPVNYAFENTFSSFGDRERSVVFDILSLFFGT